MTLLTTLFKDKQTIGILLENDHMNFDLYAQY